MSGSAKLCCTVSHLILLPPSSVLTMPPEREYNRLLAECFCVCRCVCLACCVPTLLVSGDLKLYFYDAACFWWRWLFGWNVETDLCCFFFLNFVVRECSDGTGGCHDCTELPPIFLHTLELPSSHYPFFKTITPRTNTLQCASSALPVNRDKEWIFLIAATISFPVGIKINFC